MFKKFKKVFHKIHLTGIQERCYTNMENQGIAAMGCCCGLAGGDRFSGFIQYQCIDCKYLTPITK
jgi:hypothetical protein